MSIDKNYENVNLEDIPLNQRHVCVISPGVLFADDYEMKWPEKSWEDDEILAKELEKMGARYVAFRRFIYDPEEGKVFLDKGWVYFYGEVYAGKDVVDGKVGIPVPDTAISNIKNCNLKEVVWFPNTGQMYFFDEEDKFVDLQGAE